MSTAAEPTNNTPKKTPRKGSKAAKRIEELETAYALAHANGDTASAMKLRVRINNVENGDPEEGPADDVIAEASDASAAETEPATTTTWNDVVAASVEAEGNRVTREQTFDRILVDLTPEERAELGEEHVKADKVLVALTDKKKEWMTEFKAEFTKAETAKREIGDAIEKKKAWRHPDKGGWICEEIFATNTRRYIDPKTDRVMCTEAMTGEDRQLALPTISADAAAKATQLELGDVDATEATDPEALLQAAQAGEDLENDEEDDLGGDETDDGDDEGDD